MRRELRRYSQPYEVHGVFVFHPALDERQGHQHRSSTGRTTKKTKPTADCLDGDATAPCEAQTRLFRLSLCRRSFLSGYCLTLTLVPCGKAVATVFSF